MTVYQHVVCPFCGCACDDIEITAEGGAITRVTNGCALSVAKFQHHASDRLEHPYQREKDTTTAITLGDAVKRVAKMLVDAEYPLLYGWSSTSCEAQKVGIELAEEVGGVIDNTTTTCHGPSILGIHDAGVPSCTLGEVRHRADLVIFWGANPVHAHPRHLRRYSLLAEGRFRGSRKERTMIVIDVRRTHTARQADLFIQVEPNQDYELIQALRMLVRQEEVEQDRVAGVPMEQLEELADALINCQFGVLFYGLGLTMSAGRGMNIDAAISLVRDLNARTKFLIMPMRGHFNVTGANKVSTWQTGHSFAVDFSPGYPRYNPGETTAVDIANRGDCDAALVIASDPVAHWPRGAAKHLGNIPLAVIDPKESLTSLIADTVIPSTMVGLETPGVIYRMDGVPLILSSVCEPPKGVRTDEEVLTMILDEVRALRRA